MTPIRQISLTWDRQPNCFPDFLEENPDIFPKTESSQKKENEDLVQEFSQKIQKELRQRPKEKERQNAWEQEFELESELDFMDFFKREKILCLSKWMSPELLCEIILSMP